MQNLKQSTSPSPSAELRKAMTRRQALSLLGGFAGAALVVGCTGAPGDVETTGTGTGTGAGTGSGACSTVAPETAGPFPADGSNTNGGVLKNVLADARAFRTDIRSDFDGSNVQQGIPLTVTMTLVDSNNGCAPLAGKYVYLWHCSRTGNYSQYSGAMNGGNYADNTFLRGVAVTDSNGQVTFTTVFPGRYSGRATHMHFEVYPDSTPARAEVTTISQLAFPASVCDQVYANTTLYPTSAANNTSNEADGIFRDGTDTEMLSITGNNTTGYAASITVGVAA